MRNSCALVLLVLFSSVGGLAQDSRAGVTVDVVFQNGTGHVLTINKGDAGPGCAFGGYQEGSVSTGYCMNVILRSTYDFVSVVAAVSYESDNGLEISSMYEWRGPILGWARAVPFQFCSPTGGLLDLGAEIRDFDCVVSPPSPPPQAAAGTYRLGTIVWDTSGTTTGTETIASLIDETCSMGAVINGNVVYLGSADITVNSAVLNIIPEAAAVPSMSRTGVALLGGAVFGIGIVGLIIAARRRRG